MKQKIIKILIIFIFFFNINNSFSYNINYIYKKIDIIYNKNPYKLEEINKKIEILKNKEKKENIKFFLIKLNKYINYKFKNKNFYNQEISRDLKEKIKNINNNSFTDKVRLEKFNKLLENNNYTFIEKELINFSILNAKVGILLNHQNFKKAKNLVVKYFIKNGKINKFKLNFLIKNVSYFDFSILTQIISLANLDSKKIIDFRIKKFPLEKYTAYNIVREYGYKKIKDCNKLIIKNNNLDLVDKKFCKIFNNQFEKKDLEDLEKLNNNLQILSDKANYYNYVSKIKGYKKIITEKQKEIGEKILKIDKNFINGYLILLHYYNQKKDCNNYKKYYKLLEENYIGDQERKKHIFNSLNLGKYCKE